MEYTTNFCIACGHDLDENEKCESCARVKRGEEPLRRSGPDDPTWKPWEWASEDDGPIGL